MHMRTCPPALLLAAVQACARPRARADLERGGRSGRAPSACLLFLDEPTSNLDVHYQLWLLDAARDLLARDCTVVAILHDLNVALEYGDNFLLLDAGRIVLETTRAADIPPQVMERVFRVRARHVGGTDAERGYWRFTL
jgi:iron complex transport system ATP-binding protein